MSNADTALGYASNYVWEGHDGNTEKARWYAAHQAYLHALEVDELIKGDDGKGTIVRQAKVDLHVGQANMWANVAAGIRP